MYLADEENGNYYNDITYFSLKNIGTATHMEENEPIRLT